MTQINYPYRGHDTGWLAYQAKELFNLGIKLKSSSHIIYACLELRNALEYTDYTTILASVSEDERCEIREIAKVKNGIDKANKKFNALKDKYQRFYQAVCEVTTVDRKSVV